jgi:signal peptidase complex subunit 3
MKFGSLIKDLSSLFNWNTKQLFVYLEAEYTNAKGVSKHKLFGSSMIVPRDGYRLRPEG